VPPLGRASLVPGPDGGEGALLPGYFECKLRQLQVYRVFMRPARARTDD